MKRTLKDILEHMIEDCTDIIDCTNRVKNVDGLEEDRLLRKGLVYSILDLGELTKVLETHIDLSISDIDWRGLKGMREIAAHRYKSMNSDVIWDVAVNNIPEILLFLQSQKRVLENV